MIPQTGNTLEYPPRLAATLTAVFPPSSAPPPRLTIFAIIVSLLIIVLPAGAQTPAEALTPAGFSAWLDTVINDSILFRASVGIKIVRAEDGATIAEHDAGKLFHPASNMKLLTTAASLALLPENFSFRTALFADKRIEDSVLKGNLYVKGGGDPLMDTLDIDSLAAIVEHAGIRRIDGDLVGDGSVFDTLMWGKGWMWDDEPSSDQAFISALAFHDNALDVIVGPGPRTGEPLAVTIAPRPQFFTVDNMSVTSVVRGEDSITVRRISGSNRIVVEGWMAGSSAPRKVSLSVFNPEFYFLDALRSALAARGISIAGTVRSGVTTGPVSLGGMSTPLVAVLNNINKLSNNLSAENLLKIIGAETAGPPGTSLAGLVAVGDYLAGLGINPATTILADGSGVSWYNAVTPDDLVRVLTDQYQRQGTFNLFLGSLPIGGVDGTLKTRLMGGDVYGRVAAKTGTLTGVSTLSGYAYTWSHELLVFSIMINHYPGKVSDLRAIQDRILTELLRVRSGP